jgi:uncharacterized repeat protein (TIGR01451 family)
MTVKPPLVLTVLAILVLGGGAADGIAEDGTRPISRTTAEIMERERTKPPRTAATRDYEVKKKPIDPSRWRPNPDSPPVSRMGAWTPPPPASSAAPQAAQTVSSPNFTSVTLADDLAIPPDSMGAVGPTSFLTHVNGRVRVHAKSTGATGALDASAEVFWEAVREDLLSGFVTDPRVRFDRLADRWFLSILDIPGDPGTNGTRILLAVSDGPAITASTVWTFFFFDQDLAAPAGDAGCLSDYPTLGVDANALYLGAAIFCGPDINNLSFFNSSAWVVRKSALLAPGTPANLVLTAGAVTAFRTLLDPATGEGLLLPHGADNYDPAATKGYLVAIDGAAFGVLVLREVSAPGSGAPTLGPNRSITVPTTSLPVAVQTPGAGPPLDGIDHRLMAAHLRDGRLWTAHQIGVDATGVASATPDRNAVRWYELGDVATASPSVVQAGTVYDAAASTPRSYWMGTIMASGQGHAALGFTAASATTRPDAATVGRLAGDPPGTTQGPPAVYQPGLDDYVDIFSPPPNARWGDYSMVSLDPCDDMTMWTIQEYSEPQIFPGIIPLSWGVRVVRLLAPPPATPLGASPPSIPVGQPSIAVTVNGATTAGAGFYDTPAAGMSSCRTLIGATVGGGVAVNAVTLVDFDTVILDLDTTAATSGPASVTITNPDGQARSGAVLTLSAGAPFVTGTKTVSGSFLPGGAIGYVVTLTNSGGAQGDNPGDELTDVLPPSLTLNGATASSGAAVADTGTNTVRWNGALAPGNPVTITIQATIGASVPPGTVVSNQGTIRYDADEDGTNEATALTDDPAVGGASDPTSFAVLAPGAAGYFTLTPCRAVDTRDPTGDYGGPALAGGVERVFSLAGRCGIPAEADAVSVNLAVTQPSAAGNVRLYPAMTETPTVSFLNFSAGQTRGNNAVVALGAGGGLAVKVLPAVVGTHFILDVNGYFTGSRGPSTRSGRSHLE